MLELPESGVLICTSLYIMISPLPHHINSPPISSVHNRYKLLQAAAGVATISFILLFMSEPTHENAVWDEKETEQMIEYLRDHTSQAGDGGNFKDSTYQAAATHITPHHKNGPAKTAKHVKDKYKTVSKSLIRHQ